MVEDTIGQALVPCLRDRQYPMVAFPTLDGMGVLGDGGHSVAEYAVIVSLPKRATLLVAMSAAP